MKINKEHIITPIILLSIIVLFNLLEVKENSPIPLGIRPFHYSGLIGVLFAPLLHENWEHLFSNIFPLGAMIFLCFEFFGKITYWIILIGWISTGLMVWAFPMQDLANYQNTQHIGASGLVYVLGFFLLFASIFNRQKNLLVLTLIIIVSFGSLVWGVFPEEFFGIKNSHVSWQSHLSGAISGIILSYLFRKKNIINDNKFDWEGKHTLSERDQALWDTYLELTTEKDQKAYEINDWESIIDNYYQQKNQNIT